MKLSKSGIFLIVVLVLAIGLGAWVTVMTCNVLAKDHHNARPRQRSRHAAPSAKRR